MLVGLSWNNLGQFVLRMYCWPLRAPPPTTPRQCGLLLLLFSMRSDTIGNKFKHFVYCETSSYRKSLINFKKQSPLLWRFLNTVRDDPNNVNWLTNMTVSEHISLSSSIYLSCNENLYSPAHKHNGIDLLRNLGCTCRHFYKDSLSKVSTVKN